MNNEVLLIRNSSENGTKASFRDRCIGNTIAMACAINQVGILRKDNMDKFIHGLTNKEDDVFRPNFVEVETILSLRCPSEYLLIQEDANDVDLSNIRTILVEATNIIRGMIPVCAI